MITMPPEFAAGAAVFHDPGDEDPDEPAARHRISCERQAWKELFPSFMIPAGMAPMTPGSLRGVRLCAACGKLGCRPQEHAGWDPTKDPQ